MYCFQCDEGQVDGPTSFLYVEHFGVRLQMEPHAQNGASGKDTGQQVDVPQRGCHGKPCVALSEAHCFFADVSEQASETSANI